MLRSFAIERAGDCSISRRGAVGNSHFARFEPDQWVSSGPRDISDVIGQLDGDPHDFRVAGIPRSTRLLLEVQPALVRFATALAKECFRCISPGELFAPLPACRLSNATHGCREPHSKECSRIQAPGAKYIGRESGPRGTVTWEVFAVEVFLDIQPTRAKPRGRRLLDC